MPPTPRRPSGSRPPASCASATAGSRCSSAARTGGASCACAATTRTRPRAGYACEKPLAARLLPERPAPADEAAAPARRRHASRRSTGTPRSARSPRASPRCATPTAASRSSTTAAAGRGITCPARTRAATRAVLGSIHRSSALAQEKTGEFWVAEKMIGGYSRADFEHCEVALFLGKNPWFSHSIPRARTTLREIAKDPARCLIVVDPRRTETAEIADIHLQVKPGTDAWLLAALIGVARAGRLIARDWLAEHADGLDEVLPHFARAAGRRVLRARAACPRRPCARPRGGSRPRRAWPRSRTSACR